jgi:hypothetical protein
MKASVLATTVTIFGTCFLFAASVASTLLARTAERATSGIVLALAAGFLNLAIFALLGGAIVDEVFARGLVFASVVLLVIGANAIAGVPLGRRHRAVRRRSARESASDR